MGTPPFPGEGDAVGAAGVFGAGDDGGCGPRVFGVFGACGVAAAATPGFAAVLLACGFIYHRTCHEGTIHESTFLWDFLPKSNLKEQSSNVCFLNSIVTI